MKPPVPTHIENGLHSEKDLCPVKILTNACILKSVMGERRGCSYISYIKRFNETDK